MFATNQIKSSYDHSGVQCMPFLFVGTSGKIQMSIQELAFEYIPKCWTCLSLMVCVVMVALAWA